MNISFKRDFYDEAEAQAVRNALLDGADYLSPVRQRLEGIYGAGRVFLTAGGSAALDILFLALAFEPGSEVILPSFTYPSAANTLVRRGLKPVFADIHPATLVMDTEDAARRVTPRTRCILPTHYGGASMDMDALMKRHQGLYIAEDAALSFGAAYRDRPLGAVGHGGIVSFHRTKNISADEGGALILGKDDPALARRIQTIMDAGTDRQDFLTGRVDAYTWQTPGLGGGMSNVHAAVLHAQLSKAALIESRQAEAVRRYREWLAPLAGRYGFTLPHVPAYNRDNHHVFWLHFPDETVREHVRLHLLGQGIDARTHYMPLHASDMGRKLGWNPNDLPVTLRVSRCLLRLPLHAHLTPAHCDRVADAVEEALCTR